MAQRVQARRGLAVGLVGFALLMGALPPAPATSSTSVTQSTWTVETVDSGPSGSYMGELNSLVLDSVGNPRIAYLTVSGGGRLVNSVVKRTGVWQNEFTGWSNASVPGLSLALDSLDRPWIVFPKELTRGAAGPWDLRLVHWNGSAWQGQTVEPPGVEAGWWPSIAIDRQDRPHIAYYSNVTGRLSLVYASWDGSSWNYSTVFRSTELDPMNQPVGHPISLRLDSLGAPRIVEAGNQTITYFWWDGIRWGSQFPDLSAIVEGVSLALDSLDRPRIAYYDVPPIDVRYVRWNGNQWVKEVPIPTGAAGGGGLSLAVDASDLSHITYGQGNAGAVPLHHLHQVLGTWTGPETVDYTESAGDTSLALDVHGLPHVSYNLDRNGTCLTWCELRYAYVPWVDSVPPASQVLSMSPYWNGDPVRATATDESGVANVTLWYRYSLGNVSWGAWTAFGTLANPPWRWSFPYPAGDGYYGFYATAVDVVGNAEPPPPGPDAIAGYDATPPVSSALPVTPYWHTSSPISVNATASEALSGVASVTLIYAYAPDNVTWGPWSARGSVFAPPWSWTFPFPDCEGNYRFHTIARDVAGNVEGNKTAAEAIVGNRGPPDYAPANPSPATPVTVGLSLPVMFSVEVANLGGDANATAALTFFNASTPGSPFATLPVSPVPSGGIAGPFTATWVSPGTPGTYAVVAIVDPANAFAEPNESNNAYTWTIEVVTGPITALVVGQPNVTAPLLYVTSVTSLSFSVFDPGGTGVRATRYQVDGGGWIDYGVPFALQTEGVHVVEWFSEDNAGNMEAVRSATIRVDDTPPVTTPSPGGGRYPSGTTFEFTALDAGSGVARTDFRVDGGAWTPYAGPLVLAVGDHTIGFRSADRLNNIEVERTLSLTIAGAPPVPEANWKPLVALVFSIILALVSAASAWVAPWSTGSRRRLRAFLLVVVPFVAAEGATGVVSLTTGLLAIPPLLGAGTAMDLAILVAGVAVSLLRIWTRPSSAPSPRT